MQPEFGLNWLNQAQNEVFHHFLEFRSLVFLELTHNDILQQCLTFSGATPPPPTHTHTHTHTQIFQAQIWAKRTKIGTKIRIFFDFLKFDSLVFLEVESVPFNESLQQCLTSSRGKAHEKNLEGPNLG